MTHMRRCLRLFSLSLLTAGPMACLPALHGSVPVSPEHLERCKSAPGFGYRKLTGADFQASGLPDPSQLPEHAGGASSFRFNIDEVAAAIKAVPRTTDGGTLYAASLDDVVLKAEFIPSCSWLRPGVGDGDLRRILEHQSIHFALMEIFAREQTCVLRALPESVVPLTTTAGEAISLARHRLEEHIEGALEKLNARQSQYDGEVYMYGVTWNDKRWSKRVREDLANLESGC